MWLSRQRELWDHTAVLQAAVKNLFATEKSELVNPLKLNPYRQEVKQKQEDDEVLRIDKSLAIAIFSEFYGKKKKQPKNKIVK